MPESCSAHDCAARSPCRCRSAGARATYSRARARGPGEFGRRRRALRGGRRQRARLRARPRRRRGRGAPPRARRLADRARQPRPPHAPARARAAARRSQACSGLHSSCSTSIASRSSTTHSATGWATRSCAGRRAASPPAFAAAISWRASAVDEFVVLSTRMAPSRGRRARPAARRHAVAADRGVGSRGGVSASVASSWPTPATRPRATPPPRRRLCHVPRQGRGGGRHELFDAGLRARLRLRRLASSTTCATRWRDELELHHQPLVDLIGARTVGFEALLRWRHPERGLIPPADFISSPRRPT